MNARELKDDRTIGPTEGQYGVEGVEDEPKGGGVRQVGGGERRGDQVRRPSDLGGWVHLLSALAAPTCRSLALTTLRQRLTHSESTTWRAEGAECIHVPSRSPIQAGTRRGGGDGTTQQKLKRLLHTGSNKYLCRCP